MKKELTNLIQTNIDTGIYFIIGIHIGRVGNVSMIKVTLDSDQGISIDECTDISRKLYTLIEESKLVENFELEVGSPGVGEPLKLHRQFQKNVGRTLSVISNDGTKVEGVLVHLDDQQLTLRVAEKVKHQIKGTKEITILIESIKKATVLVTFN